LALDSATGLATILGRELMDTAIRHDRTGTEQHPEPTATLVAPALTLTPDHPVPDKAMRVVVTLHAGEWAPAATDDSSNLTEVP